MRMALRDSRLIRFRMVLGEGFRLRVMFLRPYRSNDCVKWAIASILTRRGTLNEYYKKTLYTTIIRINRVYIILK